MIYSFETFELDTERRELRAQGVPVSISPKSFAVLHYLIARAERMVTKNELLDAFWPANASEAALLTTISQVRKALGEVGKGNGVVKTYHGQGFRLVVPVVAQGAPAPAPPEPITLREQRVVAVLSVQLGHVTEAAAQDFSDNAKAAVEAHQGHLAHMLLDGFTASFGHGEAFEDSARRALYCAATIRDQASKVDLSCGIDAGAQA